MQGRGQNQPSGIVYNTAMRQPDAALALGALYAFASRNDARVGAVCVSGAGFDTAVFCDIVARFYTGALRNGNEVLAVGLAAVSPMPPDAPMVKAALERKKENGEPQYPRSVARLGDTSQAEALLRNGVTFNPSTVMALDAPATALARALDLNGAKEIFQQRVRRLVIVDSSATAQDPDALARVGAEWPGPVFLCPRDIGEALPFPGSNLDALFAWAPAHPIADAYRAFKAMPYDAPMHDLAAMHYAVLPQSGFFEASEPGTITARNSAVQFTPGKGNVRRLALIPAQRDAAISALVTIATASTGTSNRGRG
jgi:hypothetical protein